MRRLTRPASRPADVLGAVADAIEELTPRLAGLIRSVPDPRAPAVGHWTVGDVAAHLTHVCALEVGGAKGLAFDEMPAEISRALGVTLLGPGDPIPEEPAALEDVAAMNDYVLALDTERDPDRLASRIERSAAEFTALCRSAGEDRGLPWLIGTRLPLSGMAGHMLFEMTLHGHDIARGADRPWRIDPAHSCLAFEAFLVKLLPQLFEAPEGTAVATGSAEIRLRGGARVVFVGYAGPRVVIEQPGARRCDVTVSADPSGMLLMISGRRGRISTAVRGHVVCWGRHPVRAMRMLDALQLRV